MRCFPLEDSFVCFPLEDRDVGSSFICFVCSNCHFIFMLLVDGNIVSEEE